MLYNYRFLSLSFNFYLILKVNLGFLKSNFRGFFLKKLSKYKDAHSSFINSTGRCTLFHMKPKM